MNLFFIGVFLILLYYIKRLYFQYNNENKLPGPFPIPIIGNLHQVAKDPLGSLTYYSLKYSHAFRFWIGDTFCTVVSDPQIIREMFINQFSNFKDRSDSNQVLHGSNKFGIITTNGSAWDYNRKVLTKSIARFTNKTLDPFLLKKTYELIKFIEEKNNILGNDSFIVENIRFLSQSYSLSSMCKIVFNQDLIFKENTKTFRTIIDSIVNIFKKFELLNVTMDIFRYLQFKLLKYINIVGQNSDFSEMFKQQYSDHISNVKFDNDNEIINPKDIMDILINDNGKLNATKEEIENVLAHCIDLFLAATETSASAIEWSFLHLINDKEHQEKMYNELKSLNKSEINKEDRSNTPLLNSFIKEILRVHPIVVFGVPHTTLNDITMDIKDKKYFIPKGSNVIVNYKALAFNEDVFKDARKFVPDRFIKSKNESDNVMSFAIGSRACPGANLALNEIFVFISNFILNYKFDSIDGKPLDETEIFTITIQPKLFKIKLTKRN